MRLKVSVIVIMILSLLTGITYAQLDELADKETDSKSTDEKEITFSIHGYVQANFVVSRNDDKKVIDKWNTSKYEFPRLGAELQLELEGNAYDIAHFFSAIRIEYNATGKKYNFKDVYLNTYLQYTYFDLYSDYNRSEISKEARVLIREAYVDLYAKWLTFRAGHQMISWGEIEGIETPSDIIMPWDYTTMSNVFEDSRLAVTAAAFNIFFAKQKLELIWIPLFQPAKIPEETFYLKGVTSIKRPRFEVRNSEYAARLSGTIGDQFRYGLGFLYGFDDMPDSNVRKTGSFQNYLGYEIFIPSIILTELIYNRVVVPTLDIGIGIGELLSWKFSGNVHLRKDHWGKKDEYKNSSMKYLTGIESTNIFAKVYIGLYVGQDWVINYTPVVDYSDPIGLITRLNSFRQPNMDTLEGFDQLYPFKWLISSNIQRYFLEGDALDIQIRFAVSIEPKFKKADYIISPYIMYKFTSGVSASIGAAIADKMNVDKHMIMLEIRYTF